MTRKVNDIIEYVINIEIFMPEELVNSNEIIDPSNYKREYKVSYTINDTEENGFYFLEAGENFTCVEDNIEELIREEMREKFKEVIDYEVFDICNEYDYQSAKVRVISVNE